MAEISSLIQPFVGNTGPKHIYTKHEVDSQEAATKKIWQAITRIAFIETGLIVGVWIGCQGVA
jgi:hypothetical protein